MRITRLLISASLLFLLFLPSCKKAERNVAFDFFTEFPEAKKTIPLRNIQPQNNWSKAYAFNGWRKNQNNEPDAMLIPKSLPQAFLKFGVVSREDRTVQVTLKSKLPPYRKNAPTLSIRLNGRPVFDTPLNWFDYQSIDFPIDKDDLYIGENVLEFSIQPFQPGNRKEYWLAVRRIKILDDVSFTSDSGLLEENLFYTWTKKTLFGEKKALSQHQNTSLDYVLEIPEKARLTCHFTLEGGSGDHSKAGNFSLYLETAGRESHRLFSRDLGGNDFGEKIPIRLDLTPFQNQIAKISFTFSGGSGADMQGARIHIWDPHIISTVSPEDISKDPSGQADIRKPFNILIYLIDCLRPDHLPFFGYKKDTAPGMAKFVRDSVLFRNAYSQSSWTRPSVGALFTGLHPFQHQAVTLKSGLAKQLTTLAEILQEAGFYTIGISSNAGVKQYFNFNQGFDYFKYHGNLGGGNAAQLNSYAFEQLKEVKTPFFMYIHCMEPHRPYFIQEEFQPPGPDDPSYKRTVKVVKKGGRLQYDVNLDYTIAQYDATIRQNDRSFHELMKELKRLKMYDNTLVVLMSDHGEEFYEHGGFAHGPTLYQEVVRQLVVMKLPEQLMAGREITTNTQEIDIFPTLLDFNDIPLPGYIAGSPLREVIFAPDDAVLKLHEEIFIETGDGLRTKAVVHGTWKMIHDSELWRDHPREWEVYDLLSDPGEKINLYNRNIIVSEFLKRKLMNWARAQEKLYKLGREDVEKALTKEEIEEFKALGYIK
jgi:arylsulfatase A-like enzyme